MADRTSEQRDQALRTRQAIEETERISGPDRGSQRPGFGKPGSAGVERRREAERQRQAERGQ